ncbi:MAG: repeat protein, partial [Verrucomicrobiales bacterium]|nr:repeat protein [Verrucomicrobiales bacterium]
DVNGDGKMDLLEKDGWWEQPSSLAGDPVWIKHPFPFAPKDGSSQMFAYDVNGDGLPDVITSLAAHGYGLAWYEQTRDGGEISFKKHLIMGNKAEQNKYGVKFSQLHALDLVDINGDGLKDIVLGKRFWAHGNHGDADPNDPAVLYWFELVRDGRNVDWVPHQIDDNSGVGTQVLAAPASNKQYPDIVVGNKKGTFVEVHTVRKVTKERWEKDQPKILYPDANKSE